MNNNLRKIAWPVAVMVGVSDLLSAGTLHLVAISGQASPDGNGVFSAFVEPVLNNRGVMAFHASFSGYTGTSANGGICAGVPGHLVRVVRGNQKPSVLAGGEFQDSDYQSGAINDAGQVAFKNRVSPNGGLISHAIFRKGPASDGFAMMARSWDTAPAEGSYGNMSNSGNRPALGSGGHVAFYTNLTGTDGGTNDDSAIFVSNADGTTVSRVVQEGDLIPGGTEVMRRFSLVPALNAAGQVAFATGFSSNSTDAIVRATDGTLDLIASSTTAPAGPEEAPIRNFTGTTQVMMNSSGVIAFTAGVELPVSGLARMVIKANGMGSPQVVAVSGMEVSGGHTLGSINAHPCINDAGQVAYEARINGTTGNGILIGETLIAKNGDPLPGGVGTVFSINQAPLALNQSGQLAYQVQINIPSLGTGYGLFFYDPSSGLREIARLGTPFLGSTISNVDFAGTSTSNVLPPGMNGLNDEGEVAFEFSLADGRTGVALWSDLPKPASGISHIAPITGGYRVKFPGIPGWGYQIQRDEDLVPPWETIPGAIQADPAGWVTFDDLGPGLPLRRFYRCAEAN